MYRMIVTTKKTERKFNRFVGNEPVLIYQEVEIDEEDKLFWTKCALWTWIKMRCNLRLKRDAGAFVIN